MKKIALFLLIISMTVLAGCSAKPVAPPTNVPDVNVDNTPVGLINGSVATPTPPPATNSQVKPVKKFYPTSAPAPAGEVDLVASQPSFVVTNELKVKLYLVDKYNPGVCYGLPVPIADVSIAGMERRNPDLWKLIKMKYNLTSGLDIYNKISQISGIQLVELAGGKYQFNFRDGQCCVQKAYEGQVNIIADRIDDTITRQETHNNPC